MNDRQRKFVAAYTGNAAAAAVAAGYSPKRSRATGYDLLQNPEIAAAIKQRTEEQISTLVATRQQRQAFWTQVMGDSSARMADRLRASELLGKSEGDFVDRLEQVAPEPVKINVEFINPTPEGVPVDCDASQV